MSLFVMNGRVGTPGDSELDAVTERAKWTAPDLSSCPFIVITISDLDHVPVTQSEFPHSSPSRLVELNWNVGRHFHLKNFQQISSSFFFF